MALQTYNPNAGINPAPQNPVNPAGQNQNGQNGGNLLQVAVQANREDIIRLVIAFVSASATFWISYFVISILAPNWWYWVIVLISFILAGIVLGAIDAAFKNKSGLGNSIVLFIIMYAVLLLVGHYANPSKDEAKNDPTPNDKTGEAMKPVVILAGESEVYHLKVGESTPWIGTKEGELNHCSFSSPSYDYTLAVSDGTEYPGGPNTIIPEKKHCFFRAIAKSEQWVTVSVAIN